MIKPNWESNGGRVKLWLGDCAGVLASFADSSVDAVITDPPYGLSFMGKRWDYQVPSVSIWEQCLRVLKPGGHLLSFAGTRTQHRMAVNIEDAGFEIRDMIAWVYGSGFPHSHDISKAIDKAAGAEREVVGVHQRSNFKKGRAGFRSLDIEDVDAGEISLTAPATNEAKQWDGWGTALKPALEPITVARKPFNGTVASNVVEHGTGGLNIDGCRISTTDQLAFGCRQIGDGVIYHKCEPTTPGIQHPDGRWPANLIHDGSQEVVEKFPTQAGKVGMTKHGSGTNKVYGKYQRSDQSNVKDGTIDYGSAARFFYCAKASKAEKGKANTHPTVKPVDLMCYLCRLVTPPGGIVLDPFMGSGTTGVAAARLGFSFFGIESDPDEFKNGRIIESLEFDDFLSGQVNNFADEGAS